MLTLAYAVAVLHGAVVLFLVTGSLLALREPRLLRLHAPVALAVLALALAGETCPLTDLELALRNTAGAAPYSGGFLGHYVLAPFGVDVRTAAAQVGIHATAVVPNVVGYGLAVARRQPVRKGGVPVTGTSGGSRRSTWGFVRPRSGRHWPSTTGRWPTGTCATSSPRTPSAESG